MEEADGKAYAERSQLPLKPQSCKDRKKSSVRGNSETVVSRIDEGDVKRSDKKPSVKEKLERYQSQPQKRKESERSKLERSKYKNRTP